MKSTFSVLLLTCLYIIVYIGPSHAQKGMKPLLGDSPAGTEKRLALVVGNKDYPGIGSLKNPLNDAEDMTLALKKLGFEVITVTNADYRAFLNGVNRFRDKLSGSDVAFFYYSGHGASYGGKNYLLPVDADFSCLELIEEQGISLNRILSEISAKKVKNSFVILDACRNLPNRKICDNAKKDIFDQVGLVRPTNNPQGSYVVYATREGSTADDNRAGRNGLFTEALLRYLTVPNMTIKSIIDKTSLDVLSKSSGSQSPGRYDEIFGEFYFVVSKNQPIVTPAPTKDIPFGPEMVYVKGGSFDMGSIDGDEDEKPVHTVTVSGFSMAKYETTVHEFAQFVADTRFQTDAEKSGTSKYFDFGKAKWADSSGINWRYGANLQRMLANEYNHPVVHVSHNDAIAYCEWLSRKTGQKYRLPTEAEWEYAAGNGSKHTKYSWGDSADLDIFGNLGYKTYKKTLGEPDRFRDPDGYTYTAPVGRFKPNEFGLFDMTGNVGEWCSDWYGSGFYSSGSLNNPTGPMTGSYRMMHGGSWSNSLRGSRVASRYYDTPSYRSTHVGFRVAASL